MKPKCSKWPETAVGQRISAALHIGFIRHRQPIPFTSLYLGDGVTGYIPLEQSFTEGGYEPSQAYAAPDSEK